MTWLEEKIKEGKVKLGICELKDCKNNDMLFRVRDKYACGACIDKIGEKMNELGMVD